MRTSFVPSFVAGTFYKNNELRCILNTRNYLFNGKMGVVAILDEERVWQPGEDAKTLHIGYGGGILLTLFNRIFIMAGYAASKDDACSTSAPEHGYSNNK